MRQISVRTPLHDDSIGRHSSYSSFEPDKQELIRQEIGQAKTSIRNLLSRFQQYEEDSHSHKQPKKEIHEEILRHPQHHENVSNQISAPADPKHIHQEAS